MACESTNSNDVTITISISIVAQDGDRNRYTVDRSCTIQKLLNVYCKQRKLQYDTVVLLFDGKSVHYQKAKTLEQLGIEDGEELQAMLHQTGGGGRGRVN